MQLGYSGRGLADWLWRRRSLLAQRRELAQRLSPRQILALLRAPEVTAQSPANACVLACRIAPEPGELMRGAGSAAGKTSTSSINPSPPRLP